MVHHPKCTTQCHLQTTTYGSRYVTLGVYSLTQLPVTYCFYACEYRPPGFAHSLFLSQARCSGAMWPCCDFTSSDDDEHNTDSNFLLLFADVGITPTLLEGLTEVDVLHIALGWQIRP